MIRRHKKWAAAIAFIALLTGGVAFAFFTSTGTGSGSATTGTASNWTVSVSNTTAGNLHPTTIGSGDTTTVNYTITNASTGNQKLYQAVIHVTAGFSPQADSGKPACTASDFSINGQPVGTSYTQLTNGVNGINEAGTNPGPAGSYPNSVTLQLIDNGANQDNCQGVTVPITVDAS